MLVLNMSAVPADILSSSASSGTAPPLEIREAVELNTFAMLADILSTP